LSVRISGFALFCMRTVGSIFWEPEDTWELLGKNSKGATAAAANGFSDSLKRQGINSETADATADRVSQNGTVSHDTSSQRDRALTAGCAAANQVSQLVRPVVTLIQNQGVAGQVQCSFDNNEAQDSLEGGTCLVWLFNTEGVLDSGHFASTGTCATSAGDPSRCDAWDAAQLPMGPWGSEDFNHSRALCEDKLGCTFSNGTETFGVCCPKQLLWGTSLSITIYAVLMVGLASVYLVNRDSRLQRRLESVVRLTEAGAENAPAAQRLFALHWEAALLMGGILAYVSVSLSKPY
jgi:hypothetical protein